MGTVIDLEGNKGTVHTFVIKTTTTTVGYNDGYNDKLDYNAFDQAPRLGFISILLNFILNSAILY
jgi:hypothetical protein